MKILTLADEPCRALWDTDPRPRLEGVELILSCGDLPHEYLEYLTNFTTAPILYVRGNHDKTDPEGCLCVDGRLVTWRGLRILGLGGSIRYEPRAHYQYTEREMARRLNRLKGAVRRAGGVDIFLTHAPAYGLNDGADPAHRGFVCFQQFLDSSAPAYFIHGHVHMSYNPMQPRLCTRGATTVINASERYLFEIPDSALPQPPARRLPGWTWF